MNKLQLILILFLAAFTMNTSVYASFDESENTDNEIVVYPNPVLGDEFNIRTEKEIIEITVMNVLGQPVFNEKILNKKKVFVEIESQERGVYIIQVKTSDGEVSTKRILLK